MKKLFFVLVVFLVLCGPVFAAWTVALNKSGYPRAYDWVNGQQLIIFKVDCTSDASSSGTQTLSTLINTAFGAGSGTAQKWRDKLAGGLFYSLKYALTGTTTAPTFAVTDEVGSSLVASSGGTSGGGVFSGDLVTGQFTPVTDLIFTSTTLGNTNVMAVYFWVIK